MHNVAMDPQVFKQESILGNFFLHAYLFVDSPEKKHRKIKNPAMLQIKLNIYKLRIKIKIKINHKSLVFLLVLFSMMKTCLAKQLEILTDH